MLYPYLQLYWPFWGGQFRPLPWGTARADKIPQLYLFGGRKRVMFHTRGYLDGLSRSPSSDYKMIAEAGHWLHWTHPDAVAHEMKLFLGR
jgi:pimeloyl-ACP methyl ester carboxylesterase